MVSTCLHVREILQFKMALCQLSVTDDKASNIERAKEAILKAGGAGARLVVLPVSLTLTAVLDVKVISVTTTRYSMAQIRMSMSWKASSVWYGAIRGTQLDLTSSR